MANKGKRMLFEDDYNYLQELIENHSDPSAEWGGGGSSIVLREGTGIDITTGETAEDKIISVDTETVAMKTDIPDTTHMVTTNGNQVISGQKVFTSSSGIQSRSSATSANRAIVNGSSTIPYVELQTGGGYNDNLQIKPSYLDYKPANSSSNEKFQIRSHYHADQNKQFTYEFTAPTSSDSSATFTVATTSDIPTNVSDLNNDSGFITGITDTMVVNALGYTPGTSNFDGAYSSLTGTPDLSIYATSASLSTVAFSGDYTDLTNKPTITSVVANTGSTATATLTDLQVGSTVYEIPQGGGSTYTFTNGLTESAGTVSWDFNNKIRLIPNESSSLLILNNPSTISSTQNGESAVIGWYNTLNDKGRGSYIIGTSNNVSSSQDAYDGQSGAYVIGTLNSINRSGGYGSVYAFGKGLQCNSVRQYAYQNKYIMGDYNSDGNYLFQLGNGTSSTRSNALTVDYDGVLVSKNIPAVSGTDGKYNLTATTSSGTTTYSWTTPTLTKTTETLTFTYSDNTTATLTVVTDVTLS